MKGDRVLCGARNISSTRVHNDTIPTPYALAFTASILHGQQGTVAGRIDTAMEAGVVQPMPFVNVAIAGTTTGATTDFDGAFRFNVDPGSHVIQAVGLVGYEPMERTVAVSAGKTTELGLELKAIAGWK